MLTPGFILTVANEEQQLYVQGTGQARFPVTAKSDLVFVNAQAGIKITFELNEKTEASVLLLQQGGSTRKATILTEEQEQKLAPKIILELDADGKAISLTLLQAGQELKGKKL